MNLDNETEKVMRQFEWLSAIKVPFESYIVLRLDGKGFSKFTAERYTKPFDPRMSEIMVTAVQVLMREFGGLYGYTESDEMSILLPRAFDLYDREVEKIVSISAGMVSSVFMREMMLADPRADAEYVAFDSRVWCSESLARVGDYFAWRQADAVRCGLNAYCYWTLRKQGKPPEVCTETLLNKGNDFKNQLLFDAGINFANVPPWEKRGVGVYYEEYSKPGVDPRTDTPTEGKRRRIKVNRELPEKGAYREMIEMLAYTGKLPTK